MNPAGVLLDTGPLADEHWTSIETLDSDFRVYRWARNRKFEIL